MLQLHSLLWQGRLHQGGLVAVRGLTTRSQIEAPPGQAVLFGTVEEQFGQPMKQPSLNHKHMSPAQEPPLIHCSPAALVKLKMFTLPRLFRQGGMMRPPCAAAPEASARRAPKRRGNFIGEKKILNSSFRFNYNKTNSYGLALYLRYYIRFTTRSYPVRSLIPVVYCRSPHRIWSEVKGGGGCPNFLTGAGIYLQSVWACFRRLFEG